MKVREEAQGKIGVMVSTQFVANPDPLYSGFLLSCLSQEPRTVFGFDNDQYPESGGIHRIRRVRFPSRELSRLCRDPEKWTNG